MPIIILKIQSILLNDAFKTLKGHRNLQAEEIINRVFIDNASNPEANLGKLLLEQGVDSIENLSSLSTDFSSSVFYKNIMIFGDENLQTRLRIIVSEVKEKEKENNNNSQYASALELMTKSCYDEAKSLFTSLGEWKDSRENAHQCEILQIEKLKRIEEQKKQEIQETIKKDKRKKRLVLCVGSVLCVFAIIAAVALISTMMKKKTIVGRWVDKNGRELLFHFDGSFEDGGLGNPAMINEDGELNYFDLFGLDHFGIGTYQLKNDNTLVLSYLDLSETQLVFAYGKDWHISSLGKLYIGPHAYSKKETHKKPNNNVSEGQFFDTSLRGASSLDEIKKILNEDNFFTPDQVRCMSVDVVASLYEEMNLTEYPGAEDINLSNKEMACILNDISYEDNSDFERLSVSTFQEVRYNESSYSIAELIEDTDEIIIEDIEATTELKRKILSLASIGAIENAWVATGTVMSQYDGELSTSELVISEENLFKNNIIVFLINGRYYFTFGRY